LGLAITLLSVESWAIVGERGSEVGDSGGDADVQEAQPERPQNLGEAHSHLVEQTETKKENFDQLKSCYKG